MPAARATAGKGRQPDTEPEHEPAVLQIERPSPTSPEGDQAGPHQNEGHRVHEENTDATDDDHSGKMPAPRRGRLEQEGGLPNHQQREQHFQRVLLEILGVINVPVGNGQKAQCHWG